MTSMNHSRHRRIVHLRRQLSGRIRQREEHLNQHLNQMITSAPDASSPHSPVPSVPMDNNPQEQLIELWCRLLNEYGNVQHLLEHKNCREVLEHRRDRILALYDQAEALNADAAACESFTAACDWLLDQLRQTALEEIEGSQPPNAHNPSPPEGKLYKGEPRYSPHDRE